ELQLLGDVVDRDHLGGLRHGGGDRPTRAPAGPRGGLGGPDQLDGRRGRRRRTDRVLGADRAAGHLVRAELRAHHGRLRCGDRAVAVARAPAVTTARQPSAAARRWLIVAGVLAVLSLGMIWRWSYTIGPGYFMPGFCYTRYDYE